MSEPRCGVSDKGSQKNWIRRLKAVVSRKGRAQQRQVRSAAQGIISETHFRMSEHVKTNRCVYPDYLNSCISVFFSPDLVLISHLWCHFLQHANFLSCSVKECLSLVFFSGTVEGFITCRKKGFLESKVLSNYLGEQTDFCL